MLYYNKKGDPKYLVISRSSHNGDVYKGYKTEKDYNNGIRCGSYDAYLNLVKN